MQGLLGAMRYGNLAVRYQAPARIAVLNARL
ncbi:hypothetical protein J2Z21_008953 [Streptomyces griseochromogenes]|uniref:Transposase n=1 Tax=Streptomyces griseochromogenes TaxID=68214 RepID=A0ABS4M996_9ACTN|nr:hypothetical protein [Streptomyces griseochromogenes]